MQVCAPVPGSVCSRRTPRNLGAVGRRSAGYWNVNAGWGVYFSVTHRPLSKSTRKIVLRNSMSVFIFARLKPRAPIVADDDRLALTGRDDALLSKHGAFLANLVLQPHQPVEQRFRSRWAARHVHVDRHHFVDALQHAVGR